MVYIAAIIGPFFAGSAPLTRAWPRSSQSAFAPFPYLFALSLSDARSKARSGDIMLRYLLLLHACAISILPLPVPSARTSLSLSLVPFFHILSLRHAQVDCCSPLPARVDRANFFNATTYSQLGALVILDTKQIRSIRERINPGGCAVLFRRCV